MTYKVFVTGAKVTLEFRILCLSSQHEDSCFRLKISVTSADTSGPLEVISEPIRVVSKASQVQKEKARQTGLISTNPKEPATPRLSGTKRERSSSSNDAVQETLLRLEQQQQEQRELIELLVKKQQVPIVVKQEQDFESAFYNFLSAFRNIPCEERAHKVRKVMSSPGVATDISEFLSCATDDNPKPEDFSELVSLPMADLGYDIEPEGVMQAWDGLYSELTCSPDSDILSPERDLSNETPF